MTTAFQRIWNSPATQRLRALEQTRIQRSRDAGKRLVHTVKHADKTAREFVQETSDNDVRAAKEDIAALLVIVQDALKDESS